MAVTGFYTLFVHSEYKALVLIVPGFVTTYLFLFILISNLHNIVILDNEKIVVTGHLHTKDDILQFPEEILYSEIQNVAIICANANSLKKAIRKSGYSSLRPFFYYEFTLKNGETKWIFIECFSKKQRMQMLNIINDKVGLNLSYKQLERKDYSIYKKTKPKE